MSNVNYSVSWVVYHPETRLNDCIWNSHYSVLPSHVLFSTGTGLVGLVAGLLGAQVCITDRKMALKLARDNVERNSENLNTSLIEVRELEWGQSVSSFNPPFHYILGADIVYIEDTFKELLRTITDLSGHKTTVLLSCKIRYERDKKFLGLLSQKFIVQELLYDDPLGIHIYRAVRRHTQ